MQHDLLVVVAEINTVKHHVACQLHIIHGVIRLMLMPPCPTPGTLLALHQPAVVLFHIDKCHITVVRFRLFVHHLEDTLRACHGHHDGIKLLAHLIDRAVKTLVKSQETGQRAKCQTGDPGECQGTAHNGTDHITHIAQLHIHRSYDIDQIIGPVRTVVKGVIQLFKFTDILFLMTEDLYHLLSFHHFLDKAVYLTDIPLLLQEIPAADPCCLGCHYQHHCHHHKRYDGQRHT